MINEAVVVGNVFFAGLDCNERLSQGNLGTIVIGGDKGDVHAVSAFNAEDKGKEGIMLEGVSLWSTLKFTEDEANEVIQEVVQACYDSIQEETFVQSKGD